jgi:hypothetical protein
MNFKSGLDTLSVAVNAMSTHLQPATLSHVSGMRLLVPVNAKEHYAPTDLLKILSLVNVSVNNRNVLKELCGTLRSAGAKHVSLRNAKSQSFGTRACVPASVLYSLCLVPTAKTPLLANVIRPSNLKAAQRICD